MYNTGRFSVYVTNISEPGMLVQGNNLWVPMQGCTGDRLKYQNLANALEVELGGWSWGAQFVDLNNDGLLDLYLTNGYISADKDRSYWFDYSKIAGANSGVISDADQLAGDRRAAACRATSRSTSGSTGAARSSTWPPASASSDQYDGRAVATADLWNRGVLDVIVANQNGPLLIYKNTVAPGNHWVQFELKGTGQNTTRHRGRGAAVLGRQAAAAGGVRRRRLRLAAAAAAALRPGQDRRRSTRSSSSGRRAQTQTIERPEADKLHTIQEAP